MDYENMTFKVEFKNKELEKLWIYLSNHCMFVSADAANAFMKCDEELIDIEYMTNSRNTWRYRAKHAEEELRTTEEANRLLDTENRRLEAENNEWKKQCEDLRKDNEALASAVNSKDDELQDLQKECDELKKDCEYMTNSRNAWRTRAKHEEEWYRKHYKEQFNKIQELKNKLAVTDPKADANAIEVLKRENRVLRCDNKKLAAACEDNKRLREVIDGKEKEINTLKKKIHELEQETADDAIRIKSLERANSVLRSDNGILWSKLEEANIPEETDSKEEHTIALNMGEATYKILLNILSSKAFGASPEYMRYSLKEFCDGRYFCQGCPLRFYNCDFDNMSDEEIEKLYKIAISKCAWHGDATAEKKINKPEE